MEDHTTDGVGELAQEITDKGGDGSQNDSADGTNVLTDDIDKGDGEHIQPKNCNDTYTVAAQHIDEMGAASQTDKDDSSAEAVGDGDGGQKIQPESDDTEKSNAEDVENGDVDSQIAEPDDIGNLDVANKGCSSTFLDFTPIPNITVIVSLGFENWTPIN